VKSRFSEQICTFSGLVEIVTHFDRLGRKTTTARPNSRIAYELATNEVDCNGQINQNPKPNPTTKLESTINTVHLI